MITVNDLKECGTNNFTFFFRTNDNNGEFSQWYPVHFEIDGITFNSAEQFMMYEKAKLFNDLEIVDKILKANNPKIIKALGREVHNFNKEIWDKYKRSIVYKGNLAKFSQNEDLKRKLLNSKGILAEASSYDKIWGIGLNITDNRIFDVNNWKGENLLGIILTYVREHIKMKGDYNYETKDDDDIINYVFYRRDKD